MCVMSHLGPWHFPGLIIQMAELRFVERNLKGPLTVIFGK